MFTLQRQPVTAISPRSASATSGKGKAVAFADPPAPAPPPLSFLIGENGVLAAESGGDMADWKRFREAGLLDEAAMERKDCEALLHKLSKRQNKTLEFLYLWNMGYLMNMALH
ncbi:protein crowded nuclei 2 [Fagus crenata]